MKEIVTFSATAFQDNPVPDWQNVARSYLEPLCPQQVRVAPSGLLLEFIFPRYPDGLEGLRPLLKAHGIDTSIWVKRRYSGRELLAAEWLNLATSGVVSSVEGTLKWDMIPLCPQCGFQEHRWRFEDLEIQNRPAGDRMAMVDWHPQVVTPALADELHKAGFTGLELAPVGRKEGPTWYALQARHVLKPLQSPPTRLCRSPRATPLCADDHNWAHPKSEFFYGREGFHALDFNVTYELFGDPQSSVRALVVSNRVYRLLVTLGVKKLVAEPIRLLG